MILPKLDPTAEYDIINAIIQAVGRNITITYVSTRSICPVCLGQDPFCPTCHGNPTVDVESTMTVLANIRWKDSDAKIYKPEGQFMDGDCVVNFMVPTLEMYEALDIILKQIIRVTVDNRICTLHDWIFKGSPINRVYLVLKQDESVGGQRIG